MAHILPWIRRKGRAAPGRRQRRGDWWLPQTATAPPEWLLHSPATGAPTPAEEPHAAKENGAARRRPDRPAQAGPRPGRLAGEADTLRHRRLGRRRLRHPGPHPGEPV